MSGTSGGEELHRGPEPESSARRWRWPGAASTPSSATGPGDYAALDAVFLNRLLGVIALAQRRERDGSPAVAPGELPVLALAIFALADVLAKEKVSSWLWEPFVREDADHKPVEAEGSALRPAIGTC